MTKMHRGVVLFLLPGVFGSFGSYQQLQQIQQPPDEFPEPEPTAIQEPISQVSVLLLIINNHNNYLLKGKTTKLRTGRKGGC